jgi:hypothetical protein
MPKPVDLSVLGLRPQNDLTRRRSLSMKVTTALSPVLALALSVSPFQHSATRHAECTKLGLPYGPNEPDGP